MAFIGPIHAKRLAPVKIDPIQFKRGSIHSHFARSSDGFKFYIVMKDKAGDLGWRTKIFERMYNKALETDVQDIHLKSLKIEDNVVIATDEKGESYKLDLIYGTLISPTQPNQY